VIARDDNMTRRKWLSVAITELSSGVNGSGGPEAPMTLLVDFADHAKPVRRRL
jgi:hypothetical protein